MSSVTLSDLRQFLNYLVEFGGEGVKDPCHHDVVQLSPIDGQLAMSKRTWSSMAYR
jgi:hypothetical protein